MRPRPRREAPVRLPGRALLGGVGLALALGLSACGGGDTSTATPSPTTTPASAPESAPASTSPSEGTPSEGSSPAESSSGTASSSASSAGTATHGHGSASADAEAYVGAAAVESALAAEFGEDVLFTSESPAELRARMDARGQDLFGPQGDHDSADCLEARAETTDYSLAHLIGTTTMQDTPAEDGSTRTVVLMVTDEPDDWPTIADLHEATHGACGLHESDTRQETAVPVAGGESHFSQVAVLGFPEAGSNQVIRTSNVAWGTMALTETTREPYTGDDPGDLEAFARVRAPQLAALLQSLQG